MNYHTPPDQSPMRTAEPLSEDFLNSLVAELDNDEVVGIIFGGSKILASGQREKQQGLGKKNPRIW